MSSAAPILEVRYPSGWHVSVPSTRVGSFTGGAARPVVEIAGPVRGEDRDGWGCRIDAEVGELMLVDPRAVIVDVTSGLVLYHPRGIPLDEHDRETREWLAAHPEWAP